MVYALSVGKRCGVMTRSGQRDIDRGRIMTTAITGSENEQLRILPRTQTRKLSRKSCRRGPMALLARK